MLQPVAATEGAPVQGLPLLLMHSLQGWLQQCMFKGPDTCLELSNGSACLYLEDKVSHPLPSSIL